MSCKILQLGDATLHSYCTSSYIKLHLADGYQAVKQAQSVSLFFSQAGSIRLIQIQVHGKQYNYEAPGLGLLAALPPPLFISPAKKEASASFWVLPSTDAMPLGDVGSGVR